MKYCIVTIIVGLVIIPLRICSQNNVSITYNYDFIGRLSTVTYTNGTVIQYCYDELGNRTCKIITSDVIAQPDIIITDLDISASDLCQAATFEIAIIQDNLGNAATGSYTNEIRLSTDTVYDPSDELLLVQYLQSIDPAGSIEINETIQLPNDLSAGDYYIIVKADPQNTVNELSEVNNIETIGITVGESNGVSILTSAEADSCNLGVGSASVVVLAGEPPYIYEWSTYPSQSESTIIGLTAGTYTVTVTDDMGCQEVENVTIQNVGSLPAPSFTYSINGLEVSFQNTTTNGESYIWVFGDTATSVDPSPIHVYATSGVYQVCLNALNTCGNEQYCYEIGVGGECSIPLNAMVTKVTGTSVNLIWDPMTTALSYVVMYRKLNENWFPEIISDTNEITIVGLVPESIYEFQIKSICEYEISGGSDLITASTGENYILQYIEFINKLEEVSGLCGQYISATNMVVLEDMIILTATCTSDHYLLIALDFSGNVIWFRSQQFMGDVTIIDIDKMSDESIIVSVVENNNLYMTRISALGEWIWTKRVNHSMSHAGKNIGFEVSNDDDILVTYYHRYQQEAHYYLSKYSSDGELIFSKRIRESGQTHPYRMRSIVTDSAENIFVMGGIGRSSGYEWILNKHSSNGDLLWTRVIRPSNNDFDKIEQLVINEEGEMYCISDDYEIGNQDLKIAKLDSTGFPIWVRHFNDILPTDIVFYGEGLAISGITGGVGIILWLDNLGEILEFPSRLSVASQINDLAMIEDKLLAIGSSDSSNQRRILILKQDLVGNNYNFACNDLYYGDDGGFSSSPTILDENFSIQDVTETTDLINEVIETDSVLVDYALLCGLQDDYIIARFDCSDSLVCVNEAAHFYFNGIGAENYKYFVYGSQDTFSNQSYGSYIFTTSGQYEIGLICSNAEVSDSFSKTILVLQSPEYEVITSETSCLIPTGTAEVVNCNCIEPVSYQWSNGGNLIFSDSLSAGFYSVVVVDSNGCSNSTSLDITSYSLLTNTDTTVCPGRELLLSVQGAEGIDSSNIVWSNGQIGSQLRVFPTNETTYSVFIENNGVFCSESIQVHMAYNECPCDIVWSAEDSGAGTLRNAIGCAMSGDTIKFAHILEGDSITIVSAELLIDKDVYLYVEDEMILNVIGDLAGYIFRIGPDHSATIDGLRIMHPSNTPAIKNEGNLTLKDIVIQQMGIQALDDGLLHNLGTLTIIGVVQIVHETP